MEIKIDSKYLWLPVDMSQEEIKLNMYVDENQIHEINIRLGGEDCDFYGALKVEEYRGQTLELWCSKHEERLSGIRQENERPENDYPYRPKLHYTPSYGWVNDPNGLVYHKGVYHLFHQYNPYATRWENMSWGHAVSTDLFHWEEQDVVLYPDEYGTAYSGCGFLDRENRAGFGADVLLFYYTAAGGRANRSIQKGHSFTQRVMWSDDNGRTFHQTDKGVIPWIAGENRDPKVFRHDPSDGFIMIMYLDKNEFAIFRSTDLLHWEETQRLDVPGMWECPLLMELPVEGSSEKKWVFWSADGYYQVGSFDGYRFEAETERLTAYCSRRAYAAQDYANTGDRTILVPWIRLDSDKGNYRGAMGLPMTLSLRETGEGIRLVFDTVAELEGLREEWKPFALDTPVPMEGEARELAVSWAPGSTGCAALSVGDTVLRVDLGAGELTVDTSRLFEQEKEVRASFDPAQGFRLRVIVDQEMIEVLGADGLICGTLETEENVLAASLTLHSEAPVEDCRLSILRK